MWDSSTITRTIGSVYLSDTANAASIIGGYSSSTIPVEWTGITAAQSAGNVYLTIVASVGYTFSANGAEMTFGSQVGTSGQYRNYILIDPTTNPTITIYATD